MRCERCGCLLVPVDSIVHNKFFECIRHLNRSHLCGGTTCLLSPREMRNKVEALREQRRYQ
jgi:hypothetical protein